MAEDIRLVSVFSPVTEKEERLLADLKNESLETVNLETLCRWSDEQIKQERERLIHRLFTALEKRLRARKNKLTNKHLVRWTVFYYARKMAIKKRTPDISILAHIAPEDRPLLTNLLKFGSRLDISFKPDEITLQLITKRTSLMFYLLQFRLAQMLKARGHPKIKAGELAKYRKNSRTTIDESRYLLKLMFPSRHDYPGPEGNPSYLKEIFDDAIVERRSYFDAPFGIVLFKNGAPRAIITFDVWDSDSLITGQFQVTEVEITPIPDDRTLSNTRKRRLANSNTIEEIYWRRFLVKKLEEIAADLGIPKVIIKSGPNIRWPERMAKDVDPKHIYDKTANELNYGPTEDGNFAKKIPPSQNCSDQLKFLTLE